MLLHLAEGLVGLGHEVFVASLRQPRNSAVDQALRASGVPVFYLEKSDGLDPRAIVRLARTLDRCRPDVIHSHRIVLRYLLPAAGSRYRPRIVHTVHSELSRSADVIETAVHRLAFRSGAEPVAVAHRIAQDLSDRLGISGALVIPNGVPLPPVGARDAVARAWRAKNGFLADDILITCVARLNVPKNQALLVRAFARAAFGPAVRLVLVGSGPDHASLSALRDALGLAGAVRLLGDRSDVPEILAASDLFALTSDWEGNPLSILEAMAAHLPVVCTRVGGIPELVDHGETGILVDRGDEEALASALGRLVRDEETRKSMGARARAVAESRFDVAVMVKHYHDLFLRRLQ